MKLRTVYHIALSGMLATSAFAQTTRPALPAGHPDISGSPGASPLPPGHPQIPGPGGSGGPLPAGHPDIGGTKLQASKPAQFGSLLVHAYQGTRNGTPLGGEKVTLELYNQGEPIQRLEGKLDKTGSFVFERLPLGLPFQPLAKIAHGGIEFQAAGDLMDPYHAGERIELGVYEAAESEPDWNIHMRHLIVEPTPQGIAVTDVFAIINSTDRAWPGVKAADGQAASLSIDLPAGASQIQLGGFYDGAAHLKEGRVINSAALLPGLSQYQLSYVIPVKDGQAKFAIVAPGKVMHMMLLVKESGSKVAVEGLKASGTHDAANGKVLVFGADDLKRGDRAVITIEVPKSARADISGALGAGSSDVAKIVAGVGGGLALAAGTGFVLLKPAARPVRAG